MLDGTLGTDLYYSSSGQVLEEDVNNGTSQVVQAQNVWSPVYVNALVLRDQASVYDSGNLDTRLYVEQDANWNVTALVDAKTDAVVQRYAYEPYGAVAYLNPDFSPASQDSYGVPYLWQGMMFDASMNLYFSDAEGGRVYSTILMDWLQTDPSGLSAGNNEYEGMGNAPTDTVDPSGLDFWGTTKQIGLWFADNTVGAASSLASNTMGAPNVYGAIRQNNPYLLIPFSGAYFSAKAPIDSYNAYRQQGLTQEDAVGFTAMHSMPIVNTVWGAAEMKAGFSSRPGEVGKELTTGDYATRSLDIGRDSLLLYATVKGASAKNSAPSNGRIPLTIVEDTVAQRIRLEYAARKLAESMADPLKGQSNNMRGPVLTVLEDSLTKETFDAQNLSRVPQPLDPILASRLDDLLLNSSELNPRWGLPGTHSEVSAVNQALLPRHVRFSQIRGGDILD